MQINIEQIYEKNNVHNETLKPRVIRVIFLKCVIYIFYGK